MGRSATVIAYGSLMSGLGLAALAPLPAVDARRVRLSGCRRGFGKLSQYGDRFAMALEATAPGAPIRAADIDAATPTDPATGLDALALTLRIPELARVAQREGYHADAFLALARLAERRGASLGVHLFAIAESVGHDVERYRRALADAVDYASPHYTPHPVAIDGDAPAIVFLPPGTEGSGRDDVVPIRVQTAETRLLTFRGVWSLKPNRSQLDYAAMCLLGECHNLSLADVLGDLRTHPPLARLVDARLAAELEAERDRFREMLCLETAHYAARFPSAPRRAAFVGGA
ncbi:MAG: hypothetical protein IT294_01115 [Deltaproteobacteria bacterium]|nr:hypothetical protein [Deltaproteobacteria bacterium]